jgi:hypothetical protein
LGDVGRYGVRPVRGHGSGVRGRRSVNFVSNFIAHFIAHFVGTFNLLPIRGPAFGYSIPIPIPTPTPSGQSIRVDSCSLAVGMVRTEGLNREWTRLGKSEVRNSKPETNSKHERGRNVQNPERWFMERADRRAVNFVSNFVGNFIAHFIGNRSPRR